MIEDLVAAARPGILPRSLGASLNGMFELRTKADYGGQGVLLLDARQGLIEAEAFLAAAVERPIRA